MLAFNSRRSAVYSRHGMVASSQPLASEIGLAVLKSGGNCVDAAIAVAAALGVTEPCSTGLGGDCFLLYYDAKERRVRALNGSGRSPAALTLERAKADIGVDATVLPQESPHCVTVPGTAAGWADAVEAWGSGSMTLAEVLEPAARLAEEGFPVSAVTSHFWAADVAQLKRGPHYKELLVPDGDGDGVHPPGPGEVFSNPGLARTMRELGAGGKEAFYQGRAAREIVQLLADRGGVMTLADLAQHASTFPEPIRATYKGHDVYEVPPNGQGIAALMALNMLTAANERPDAALDPTKHAHGSAPHMHLLIELMRLAFADARAFVADPDVAEVPVRGMLDEAYAAERSAQFDPARATADVRAGTPLAGSDTVSFQVVDKFGNAVSMVNSNYEGFGSGLVPLGCGFPLQSRGCNFSLTPGHPNALAPLKRPYHTIIPCMILHSDTQELFASLSNMGGFMQPQGHLQLVVNLLDYGMDAQAAIDAPRFCIRDGTANGAVAVEDGVAREVAERLREMGHHLEGEGELLRGFDRVVFGRAQIIVRDRRTGVLCAGSDGRADGCAIGY